MRMRTHYMNISLYDTILGHLIRPASAYIPESHRLRRVLNIMGAVRCINCQGQMHLRISEIKKKKQKIIEKSRSSDLQTEMGNDARCTSLAL